jgi:phosphatidylinositol glycan class B
MHMFVNKRPALRERARELLADRTLLALLALAMLVRLGAIVAFPSLHHPDENFQLFEQAHRIAFGYGIVPWEFRDGIRSPVLPYVLAGLFWLGEQVLGGPEGYLLLARSALAATSLLAVATVYRMGRRTSATHALMAGLVAATWFELVYFAGRPLTEAVATTFLLAGLALAAVPQERLSFRRLVAIGFCLGLALMLRFHLGPGLLVAAVWVGGRDLRTRWWPMGLGGLFPLIVFGAADWLFWGAPFSSYVEALRIDLIDGKASSFGVESPIYYFEQLADTWAGVLPAMAGLVLLRARTSTLWIAVALVIIASHTAIPHKEYRFVFPAFACLAVVAAMGSADLIEYMRRLVGPGRAGPALVPLGAALWVGTSAVLAFAPGFQDGWFEAADVIAAEFALAHQPDLCGVLFYNHDWASTGGYAHLHRDVPIFALENDQDHARQSTAAFNAIVLTRGSLDDFTPQFTLQRCSGDNDDDDVCVMRREGACTPASDLEVNAMLRRIGE